MYLELGEGWVGLVNSCENGRPTLKKPLIIFWKILEDPSNKDHQYGSPKVFAK